MSLFFDVWTNEGFVLVSDVRIITNGMPELGHKISRSSPRSPIKCAIAVCGEYPSAAISFFHEALFRNGSLRNIAHEFAKRWVDRFGGTEEYSAVHLVGFEKTGEDNLDIPQMWFWANWSPEGYRSSSYFQEELESFGQQIPRNNHIPQKILEITRKFPEPTFRSEAEFVDGFLRQYGPYFTWNGDLKYWQSAADSIAALMKLLRSFGLQWSLDETARATKEALAFLARLGVLLPKSTVGLSERSECDVVIVRRDRVDTLDWAKIDEQGS